MGSGINLPVTSKKSKVIALWIHLPENLLQEDWVLSHIISLMYGGGEYYFLTSLLRRISCTGVYLCSWQRPVSSTGQHNYSQSKTFHASDSSCPRSMVQGVRHRPRIDSGHRLSRSTSVKQLEVNHVKPGINAEIVPIEASTPREQGRRAVCTPLFHWWSCNAGCR